VLFGVQFLEVEQGVLVVRIEPEHFGERVERAVHETAAAVVEAQAQQHVGVLEAPELWALEQGLMLLDRAAHLPLLAQKIAEHHPHLQRVGLELHGVLQAVDGEIQLAGHEEVQGLQVVRRLQHAASVDQPAVFQLVALVRLATRDADEQRDQRHEQEQVVFHQRCAAR
jgi:hypothetical protein